jgi:Ala-tRNA(Pro) deacylase
MAVTKLKTFLDSKGVAYSTIDHAPALTARETAAATPVARGEFAKTVLVKVDGTLAMAVVPASRRVDTDKLARLLSADRVEIATEDEFKNVFPGCELGAMPPFGNLYDLEVFVAEDLSEDDEIVFNAGTHNQSMRIAYADYERLVKPMLGEFAAKH